MITVCDPTVARLNGFEGREKLLDSQLTYVNKSVAVQIARLKKAVYFKRNDPEGWQEKLDSLQKEYKGSLLFKDEGGFWTYSGLALTLAEKFSLPLQNTVPYPESKPFPWENKPTRAPRPYQLQAKEALLRARHGAVEIGTGLGKSFIILLMAKELGLKTVVMAPSLNIAEQLYKDFKNHLGLKRVGRFYDGKKESKKQFVIAVAASLTRVEPGTEHWKQLSSAQVFFADESHTCPAKTLAKVCFGLLKDAPYRFFFSGTQLRNDGLHLLLKGITSEIVFRMTVREGVDQGYLAKPLFFMMQVESKDGFSSDDANEMTRKHLFYNPRVNERAAEFANNSVTLLNRPVVILIEELEQFNHLLPHLRHKVAFAHGALTAEQARKIPEAYRNCDNEALVEAFNRGEYQILVGTSCVATGTDFRNVRSIVYLRGGTSEIEVRQAVGRGTRLVPGKDDCLFLDFQVTNQDVLDRHALNRASLYEDIYRAPKFIQG